jgi:hypothetical protein
LTSNDEKRPVTVKVTPTPKIILTGVFVKIFGLTYCFVKEFVFCE